MQHRRFSSKATASAPRGAALYEIVERLLRFDPLPTTLRLTPSPQAGAFAEAIISRTSAAGSE